MRTRPLSSSVFMKVSESRIERLRWSGSEDERWYVRRLFERPGTYGRWESFHFDLMRKVASSQSPKGQVIGLRKARFALLQKQSLFQHFREDGVRGRNREILMSTLRAGSDFSRAIVTEHNDYLRSNSSLLCATYLGDVLLDDDRFDSELERYHDAYMEYFKLYCDWIIADVRGEEFPLRPMMAEMKQTLLRSRTRLLDMPVAGDRRKSRRPIRHLRPRSVMRSRGRRALNASH